MGLSKRSLKGIHAFSRIQGSRKNLPYLIQRLEAQEQAIKMNERFDVEKAQKEARVCRIQKLKESK